ncbi:MAG: molybdate ABC transporter substrate-binding protein [Burkholderiaceae bacterium]|nr:molybdate ABC transporter substrate-binding protein [Rhodoferax sp.]MCB2028719.1 molybdate ABC transporter substrate-binding protein [Rhodoferax sp.]MCP5261592.1 molybdate ABC transporter substrate-binding protein [Rhodoferax sp.]
MTPARRACLFALLLSAGLAAGHPAAAQTGPAVAAASDLKFALDDVAAAFRAQTGQAVRISYGSSGNFTRQIQQDAPFELFLSADEAFVFQLAQQGHTIDRGALYATGRIVLFAPTKSPLRVDPQLADLRAALSDGRITRFAIANPEHAPYGRAAREALQSAGLWDSLQGRLVLGENVSQAAQFAVSGSTQGGIFAYSLAMAPAFASAGRHVLVPEDLHQPLRQRMVLTRKAGPVARDFYQYLQQPPARAIFKRFGFVLPGEPLN